MTRGSSSSNSSSTTVVVQVLVRPCDNTNWVGARLIWLLQKRLKKHNMMDRLINAEIEKL